MDADTEVFQRIVAIDGFVGTLLLLLDTDDDVDPTLRRLATAMSECTKAARQAVIQLRPEAEIHDRVRELVDAARQTVGWCVSSGSTDRRPRGLSEQIHRDALDLERELGSGRQPLA